MRDDWSVIITVPDSTREERDALFLALCTTVGDYFCDVREPDADHEGHRCQEIDMCSMPTVEIPESFTERAADLLAVLERDCSD